jgi:hypothetical protein
MSFDKISAAFEKLNATVRLAKKGEEPETRRRARRASGKWINGNSGQPWVERNPEGERWLDC